MNNAMRLALAGTTLLGAAAAAHAGTVALPTSGTADLWLFVENTSTSQTFAEDTGYSVLSLLPTASLVPNATLSTAISDNINQTASTALSTFLSASGSYVWGVEAINVTTGKTKTPGVVDGLTANGITPSLISGMEGGNLVGWTNGFEQDAQYLQNAGLNAAASTAAPTSI
jgi:hypothetical protein